MTAVLPADNTYTYIERKIRRLTASSSEASLTSADIQRAVNLFYSNDFPYAIKLDQTRQVYKFLTIPNVDRYPVDVNNLQGFRAPVYFAGVQGNFFKNRDQLYNLYPRYATKFTQGLVARTGNITGIAQPTNPTLITSPNHGLITGSVVLITDVGGMVQLNDNVYNIHRVNANSFTLDDVDNTAFGAYTGGGIWQSTPKSANFTLFGNTESPFPQPNSGLLSTQVVIGGIDIDGNPIRIIDDGGGVVDGFGVGSNTTTGQLLLLKQNNVGNNIFLDASNVQKPAIPPLSPIPIPSPPSPETAQYVGTVNYITTEIELFLDRPFAPGTQINIWASTYQVGRPYNLLYWNNEFTIRPVPDNVYLVEVEAYQSPSQFMQTTDNPQLMQWAQYIAFGTAMELLRERQDMEGVENLREGFMRQESLVLERQGVEEIGQPNVTLFNTTQLGGASQGGWGIGAGF